MSISRALPVTIALYLAFGGCRGVPATPSPARPTSAAAAALRGSAGDTAAFGLTLVGLAYAPDLVTYELKRPSYVTILSVTAARIESIIPRVGVVSQIEMSGSHLSGLALLGGGTKDAGVASVNRRIGQLMDGDARLADVQEYNRCIAQAEAMSRRDEEASRRVVGRDSAGRPIYGPPTVSANERNYEARCSQRRAAPQPTDPSGLESAPRQAGRFLLVFASDSPVELKQVLDLAITESDPKLMASAIGRKLFDSRDAIWSGVYRAW